MSEFYKRFLMEEGRALNPASGRYIALGAFGKHPGWDDHVEDLGLETDSLILAKRVLYIQGVGGCIDTGAWEKLKEEQRLPEFNHAFIWQRGDQLLVGRMWSSSDGKGRTRYPMIVCAHCIGAPVQWALDTVLPRLEQIESACKATKSAEDVRSILAGGRTALRGSIDSATARSSAPTPATLHQFVSADAFGPDRIGWFRILYWLSSQAKAFAIAKFNLKGDLSGLRAQQARLPVAGTSGINAGFQAWSHFFSSFIDPLAPALYIWPLDGGWIDVTIGEPSADEFFCLRASRAAIPFATEVPYDFDQAFRDEAARQLEDFENGRPIRRDTAFAERSTDDQKQTGFISATQRWFKSLGGKGGIFLACIVIGAVAAVVIHNRQSGRSAAAVAKPEPAAAAPGGIQRAPPPATQPPVVASVPAQNPSPPSNKLPDSGEPKHAVAVVSEPPRDQKSVVEEKPKPSVAMNTTAVPMTVTAATQTVQPTVEPARTTPPPSASPNPVQTASVPIKTVVDANPSAAPAVQVALAATSAPSAAAAPAQPKTFTNGIGMVLLWVAGLPGSGDGGWVGKYEVTQAEYRKIAEMAPDTINNSEQPVGNMTWSQAMDFCRKLSASEAAANRLPAGFAYTLPTLQQWDFFVGDSSFDKAITSRGMNTLRSAPERVGTMPPNRYGLYDVLGNVWEWCVDPEGSAQKPLRGGAYDNGMSFQFKPLEPSTVRRVSDDAKLPDAGFRCVLVRQP